MQNETNEQRHARWEREKEADQAAIQLGLAYREARHGVCYWDKHASEAFRAGFEAGKKAQEQLAVAQQGVPEGRKLVPVEPQDAQQAAGATAIRFDTTLINKMWTANKVYREMVAAAPQSPAAHPTTQGLDALTKAARSVLTERARQIAAEGYTPEQDDSYNPGVLALHGGLYACHAYDNLTKKRAPEGWQWDEKWWKPKDPRSNLVKAGALILAEIERMDRSFAAQAKQGGTANG